MSNKNRLFSLDALRGLDMLFLCVVQPLIVDAARIWDFYDIERYPVMRQFSHYWGGFTAYDLIMPLFIFMCGAAIPFALSKRLDGEGRATAGFWKHIGWRVLLLWILGMIAQGHLLTFNWHNFIYFSNTLQAIAVGYLIAASVFLIRNKYIQLSIPFILAVIYGLSLALGGDYSVSGNFAMKIEKAIVNVLEPFVRNRDRCTWYWSSLMFGVMALCGMFSTQMLLSKRGQWTKVAWLSASGALLWASGYSLELLGVPCIKHIFTVTFTAQAMGISVLLLAALYIINDIWHFRRGWSIVTLYGQTALAAYMIGEIFRAIPLGISSNLFSGLSAQIGGRCGAYVIYVGEVVVLTFLLHIWRGYRMNAKSNDKNDGFMV